jgi:phage tail sheath protein FI
MAPGVYIEEGGGSKPIEGVGTAVAAFVGFAEKGTVGVPTQIDSWSKFTNTFGGFVSGFYLAHAVYGYFNNGGTLAYITRLPGEIGEAHANGKADGQPRQVLPRVSLRSRTQSATPTLEVVAREQGATGLSVEVRPPDEGAPEDQFTIIVHRPDGPEPEVFANLTFGKSRGGRNVVEFINGGSKLVTVRELEASRALGPAERAPALDTYQLVQPTHPNETDGKALALGEVSPVTFEGKAADRTGIFGYEVKDEVTMVCAPDLMAAYQQGLISLEGVLAVQKSMLVHCETMKDRVAILDCPPDMSPDRIHVWVTQEANYDSKYGALYYPWIHVADPLGKRDSILVPPSGHMAGIWARTDAERGVHKAPANEVVRGALNLATEISRSEQEVLNPNRINCIRSFPGRGIRVWGARTLSSDASWRYLNVRRLFNFVEKSIENGTQWVVFEPNDLYLWEKIKRDVSAFLTRVWRDGALFGAAPEDAFYVRCDDELNSLEERDAGRLTIEVAIAPVKPAEFVIFRISQYAGGQAQ